MGCLRGVSTSPSPLPLPLPLPLSVVMLCRGSSFALLLALACCAHAFYLPGLAPTDFCTAGEKKNDPKSTCKVGGLLSLLLQPLILLAFLRLFSRRCMCTSINWTRQNPSCLTSTRGETSLVVSGLASSDNLPLPCSFDFCQMEDGGDVEDSDPVENLGQVSLTQTVDTSPVDSSPSLHPSLPPRLYLGRE